MTAGKLATLILVLSLGGGAQGAERKDATLSTLVAGLQRLQDQVAAGDVAAFKAQPAALKSIGAAIDAASPDLLKDSEERNAAAIYLLSGGPPGPIVRHLSSNPLPKDESILLRAALTYATGHRGEAKALFGRFDPRRMDLRLAGQFAYAQAELASEEDDAQALEALDLARLLSPGGLVEEASLRREIRILGASRNIDRFRSLSLQYVRRFPRSVYYDSFRQNFLTSLEHMALGDDMKETGKYVTLAAAFPAEDKRHALLTLARAAALTAHSQAATTFAHAVLQDPSASSADQTRARLYDDAVRILTGDNAQTAKDLETLPADRLDRKDSALLAAVRKVARAVSREAVIPQSANEAVEDTATMRSAEEVVQRVAAFLGETGGDTR
jgi:chemotaxis protein MotC